VTGGFTGGTSATLSKVDKTGATWVAPGKTGGSATLTATGFSPATAPPAGTILTSAKVRVVHSNDQGASKDARTAQFTPAGSSPIPLSLSSPNDSTAASDEFDVTKQLVQAVYDGTFTGGQLSYTVDLKHEGTELVDALQLELTYTPPALRAESGCTQLMYPSSASCALVTAVNNSGNRFYVQGTTYAPKAVLDVTLNNATEPIFRFGVVARSLWVKETGSVTFTGPVIEVPDDSPGFVFGVYLSAYVCPCSPGDSPAARARVAYVDGDPANPVPGARQVSVLSWSGSR
jgi:hypothetical protein